MIRSDVSRIDGQSVPTVDLISCLTSVSRQSIRKTSSRMLTTDQICEVFFDNETTARHRLSIFTQLRLLDRFQPVLAPGWWVYREHSTLPLGIDRECA